jgi:hypothetical protein
MLQKLTPDSLQALKKSPGTIQTQIKVPPHTLGQSVKEKLTSH